MKTRFLSYGLACLLMVFGGTAAFAQGFQVGTVSGQVLDDTGGALPGVTVELISEDRGTTRVELTDSQGDFRFSQVPVGTYTVVISLTGFQNRTLTGNRVSADKNTRLNVTLPLSAIQASIVVTGEAPVVDRTNPAVDTSIPEETFEKLPLGRSYQTLMTSAPGVVGRGNANVNGALRNSNVFLFDGVDTTDTTTGTFGANMNFEAIQEASIITAAASAEYGRATGAIVNVITKSGTNELEGSAKYIINNDDWDEQNKTTHPLTGESFARTKNDVDNITYTGTLGGPLWRDRLWFFGAYSTNEQPRGPVQLPISGDEYTYTVDFTTQNYRLTTQLTPTQNLWVKFDDDPAGTFLVRYGRPAEIEALTAQDQGGERWAGQYTGILGDNFSYELMYGTNDSTITVGSHAADRSLTNGALHFDLATNRFYNGPLFEGFVDRPREQAVGAISYFTQLGDNDHELKFGADWQKLNSSNFFAPSNGQMFIDESFDHVNRTFVPLLRRDYAMAPSTSSGELLAFYALDKFEVGDRLFFNLGVRYEEQTGESDIGRQTVDTQTISPRLSGSYDLMGDGRALVRGTYGRYYQSIIQDFSDNFAAVPQYRNFTEYIWNGTEFVFRREVDFSGSSLEANLDLEPTYVDEITVGVQYQLAGDFGVGARYLWREWDDLQDDIVDFDAEGNDILRFVNNPDATREYNGLQLTLEKRFSRNWAAIANYTISESSGNYYSDFEGALLDYTNQQCEVQDENIGTVPCADVNSPSRHEGNPEFDRDQFNLLGLYSRPVGPVNLSVGTNVQWSEGIRFARRSLAEVLVGGESTGTTYSYFYEDPGSRQLGSIWTADLSLEGTYMIAGLAEIGVKAEVFNVTDEQKQDDVTETLFCTDDTSLCQERREEFGLGLTRGAYQSPRSYRASVVLRF
ncbi:MAG: TonB-dependent receptor [Acidobacteria bacterium]|nr:TonB-dependent receptor [Acidobacteriota bacterium]